MGHALKRTLLAGGVSLCCAAPVLAAAGYSDAVVGNFADVTTPTVPLIERDRIGRTVAFLARLVSDGWTTEGRAVAADRETALHVDPADGRAGVFTTPDHPTPFVYFMRTPGPPEVCQPGVPLTFRNVEVYRIGPGGSFDLDAWRGHGGIAYTLTAEAGVLTSSNGSIY